jgi:hypothetical protein
MVVMEEFEFAGLPASYADAQSLFARTPADALQCKLAAHRTAKQLFDSGTKIGLTGRSELIDVMRLLTIAPVYLWAPNTSRLVIAASESFPLEERAYFPSPMHAMCVFASPSLWLSCDAEVQRVNGAEVHVPAKTAPLSALAWTVGKLVNLPGQPVAMQFYGFSWVGACAAVVVRGSWPIFEVPDGMQSAIQESRQYAQFAMAAASFIEQRVVVEAAAQVQRQTRKQAQRLGIVSDVKTIQLRATERTGYEPRPADGDAQREYSWRWIVRGHWRKQYYPKAGQHVPVWIDSYVKGPEDKPLMAPRPEVFAVVR